MATNGVCPKVSVVVPCYNNTLFVRQSVESVLSQDYPNIEVIVVDDGSTDDSIAKLAIFGNRIRVIQQPNQGPAAARNRGIRHATGEFIAFNDSDDLWLPGKVSAQVSYLLRHPEFIACFCSFEVWDGKSALPEAAVGHQSSAISIIPEATGWLYLKLLKESVIHTITIMIRREIVTEVGFFNESLRIGEDHEYWLRLSRRGKMAKLDHLSALYRDNLTSTTHQVHSKNYSLEVLKWAIDTFGRCCPGGECISLDLVDSYIAERHFSYAYHCFRGGYRILALHSFKSCLALRKYIIKSFLGWLICQTETSYRIFWSLRGLKKN